MRFNVNPADTTVFNANALAQPIQQKRAMEADAARQNALAGYGSTSPYPEPARAFNAMAQHGGPTKAAAGADAIATGAQKMPQGQKAAFDVAAQKIGMNETAQRAALSDFLATGGQNLDPATTAWCAAFVNAALEESGVQGTGKLNARSFLDWGEDVSDPQRGDIAVFSRGDPSGWQGHVGFFDGYDDSGNIRVLGGNQSNAVNVKSYGADRLLGFRRAPAQPADLSQPQNAEQYLSTLGL